MERFRKCLLVALGFLILGLVLDLTNIGPAIAAKLDGQLVQIVNTPAQAVPTADQSARSAFQKTLTVSLAQSAAQAVSSFDVPAGKRLVIEYVAGRLLNPGSTYVTIVTSAGGNQGQYPLSMDSYGVIAQTMRVYADAGSSVQFVVTSPYSYASAGLVTISGYLVDMP